MKEFYQPICWILSIAVALSGCGKKEPDPVRAVDLRDMKAMVFRGEQTRFVNTYDADFVILGGSFAGLSAALATCSSGRSTILIEESDSFAACFGIQDTLQYIDNRFTDITGSSQRYHEFRRSIREWYKNRQQKQVNVFSVPFSGLDDFESNNFCFESEAAIDVIRGMLEKHVDRDRLIILTRHKLAKVIDFNKKIASLNLVDLDYKVINQVTGWLFIDATETGELLSLAGIEYSIGRESREETGEPHAPDVADSSDVFEYYYYLDAPSKGAPDYYESDLLNSEPENPEGYVQVKIATQPRRLKALTRIVEQDISAEFSRGPRARFLKDSVGIGYSPMRVSGHKGRAPVVIPTKPFQIPYGALVPRSYTNVLAAGKAIGTTFITSSAYSVPSVEFAIGEGAGEFAAFCAGHNFNTHKLIEDTATLEFFRDWLIKKRRIPIYWYDDVMPDDSDFTDAQLKPFNDPGYREKARTLHFRN